MEPLDLAWLAGLLEGEGCFSLGDSPTITLVMTDRDVVERAAALIGRKVRGPYRVTGGRKPSFHVSIHSEPAIALMQTLEPLMGTRRRARIQEIIQTWKAPKPYREKQPPTCHPEREHYANGKCRSCYRKDRHRGLQAY